MEKINGILTLVERNINLTGKIVADVGCGTGANATAIAQHGAIVYAVDTHEVIERARSQPPVQNVLYYEESENWLERFDRETKEGEDNFINIDLVLFSASLHHVPTNQVKTLIDRYIAALKEGGLLMFIEPVNRKGYYIELTSLIEEERDKLVSAYEVIRNLSGKNLTMLKEDFFYLERTMEVFSNMVAEYISNPVQRAEVISRAETIVNEHLKNNSDPTIFRSLVRLNLFKKL